MVPSLCRPLDRSLTQFPCLCLSVSLSVSVSLVTPAEYLPPLDQVVEMGVIPRLIDFLSFERGPVSVTCEPRPFLSPNRYLGITI
jgi:hypothetical protein